MKLVFLIVIIISLTDGRYIKTWTQVDLDAKDPQIKPSKSSFIELEIFTLDLISMQFKGSPLEKCQPSMEKSFKKGETNWQCKLFKTP